MTREEEMKQLEERKNDTEEAIQKYFEESKRIMMLKNRNRGDCWRNIGLFGMFIEINALYFRLRNLIYLKDVPTAEEEFKEWLIQIENALEDMRNYTILAQLCIDEKNFKGITPDDKLL